MDVKDHAKALWRMHDAMYAHKAMGCEHCGEDEDFSPNIEAFEISGELVCDACAEAIFDDHSRAGMDG